MASEIQKKPPQEENVLKELEKLDLLLGNLITINKTLKEIYLEEAKRILQNNKNTPFAGQLFTKVIDDYLGKILYGKKDEAELAYEKFEKLAELLKDIKYLDNKAVKNAFDNIYKEKIVNGEYKELYDAYKNYNQSAFRLSEFIEAIYNIRNKIIEGQKIEKNESELAALIKNKLIEKKLLTMGMIVPVKGKTPSKVSQEIQNQKEEINRNLEYIKKRIGDVREGLKSLGEFISNYVKQENAKQRLLYFVNKWEKEIDEIDKETRHIENKKIVQSKKVDPEKVRDLLKNVKELASKIDGIVKNEIVNEYELKIAEKAAFFFVAALYTGNPSDMTEVEKYRSALEEIKKQSPLKYSFCANLIPTFIREISPLVYNAISSTKDVDAAIYTTILAKKNGENIEQLKKIYGSAFVEYVLENSEKWEENKTLRHTASLLLYTDNSFIDAINNVLMNIKNEEKLKELKNRYGSEFVEYIQKNHATIGGIFGEAGGYGFITLATKYPKMYQQLKQKNLEITDNIVFERMNEIIRNVNTFRTRLGMIINNPTVDEKEIENIFELYKPYFGDNIEFLKTMYDIDTIANREITGIEDAKELFKNIAKQVNEQKSTITSMMQGEKKTSDLITNYYLLQAHNLLVVNNLQGSAPAVYKAITDVAGLDSYLLPQFFKKVLTPLATTLKDYPEDFAESLLTFTGLFVSRYPKADASFLVHKIRERFLEIFEYFEKNLPEETKKMTHWELQEETRERGELGEYEVYPPQDLYRLRPSWWERRAEIGLPGVPYFGAFSILPSPQMTYPAQMPYGPLNVKSGAEELHLRLDTQLNQFIPDFGRPTLSKDLRISYISRQVLLMAIRRAFGQVSMYSPEDLISATAQVGGFFRYEGGEEISTSEGGIRGEVLTRYPQGGLLASLMGTKREEKTKGTTTAGTEVSGQITGGGVGPVVKIEDRFTYSAAEKEGTAQEREAVLNAQINKLIALSKEKGPLLVYIPEIYEYEKSAEGIEETENRLAGKLYYINPNGEVYQLAVGYNEEDALRQFLYGSVEKENVLASLRKYGAWGEGKFENFGGAMGFTLDKIAAFAMEDAIRRATVTTEEVGGRKINKVNLKAVGYSGVVALAINGVSENGTLAFIMRTGIPVVEKAPGFEKGTYTLETIIREIEPSKSWELRFVGGYPATAGVLYKEIRKEGQKEKGIYGKFAAGTQLFYENLFSQEEEVKNVVNYVKTALGEFYHWSDDKINREGNLIGFSLMLSAIEEEKDKILTTTDAGNFYASVIAAHYAKKWGGFVYAAKQPGYANIDTISQKIDYTKDAIAANPEAADNLISALANEIDAMKNSTIWKEVAGIQFNLDNWTIRFLNRAEIMETKGKTDLGYSIIEGVAFVGYNKGIQPYLKMRSLTYAGILGRYLDLIFASGAANIKITPSQTFEYDVIGEINSIDDLKNALEKNKGKIIKDILGYYKIEEGSPENYEIEFAHNAKAGKTLAKKYYVLMVKESGKKMFYVGTDEDRENWIGAGYSQETDIYTLRIEDNKLTIEVPNITNETWFRRVKAIGGLTFKMEGKDLENLERVGQLGGILTEVFNNNKKQIILAALAGKKELKDIDIEQYAVVISSKWDRINFKDLGKKLYGYLLINHTNRTITIIPGEEPIIIERTLFGAGTTIVYFDGLLGETSKLDFFIELGPEKVKTEKGLVGRVGAAYDKKVSLFGTDAWLNFGIIGYKGYWPIGPHLEITRYETLYPGGYEQYLRDVWGIMFTLGGRW